MKITKRDLSHSRNMLKALGKGKWDLDGIEILAFAEMMKWFSGVQRAIEEECAAEDALLKEEAIKKQKQEAGILEPKPVESIVKPIDSSKKSKKKE